jgi:anthranilate/para-aminobenzoate synthase component I
MSMEIIDELEPTKRGSYRGSISYIGFNGTLDLNIVIRIFIIKDSIAYLGR